MKNHSISSASPSAAVRSGGSISMICADSGDGYDKREESYTAWGRSGK